MHCRFCGIPGRLDPHIQVGQVVAFSFEDEVTPSAGIAILELVRWESWQDRHSSVRVEWAMHYFCVCRCPPVIQVDENISVPAVCDVDILALVGVQAEDCAVDDGAKLWGQWQIWHEEWGVRLRLIRHGVDVKAKEAGRVKIAEHEEEGGVGGVAEPAPAHESGADERGGKADPEYDLHEEIVVAEHLGYRVGPWPLAIGPETAAATQRKCNQSTGFFYFQPMQSVASINTHPA